MAESRASLLRDIEEFLRNDPQKLERFRGALNDYKTSQKTAADAYKEIEDLIRGDERLSSVFHAGPPENVDDLSRFVHTVQVNLSDSLLDRVNFITTLFVDQLIPARFFEHIVLKEISQTPQKVQHNIANALRRLSATQTPASLKRARQNMLRDGVVDEFILQPDILPDSFVQILVMIGLVCKKEALSGVLGAIDLHAFGLLPYDVTITLFRSIDEMFAFHFEELVHEAHSENIFVTNIFEHVKRDTHVMGIAKWALGSELFEKLLSWTDYSNMSLQQVIIKMSEEERKKEDHNLVALAPCIAELQLKTLMRWLKIMMTSLKSGGNIVEPDDLVASVAPDAMFDRDDRYYGVLFEKFLEIGAEAQKIHTKCMNEKMEPLSPSSDDWRADFKARLRKNYVVRNLVFVGTVFELLENMDEFWSMCEKFLDHFSGLEDGVRLMKAVIENGECDLDESGAMAVHYLGEMMGMVRSARCLKEGDLTRIADLVFSDVSPLRCFEGYSIANVDMVLKCFATYLNKAIKSCPEQFTPDGVIVTNDSFAYHVSVKSGTVTVRGYLNPICMYSRK